MAAIRTRASLLVHDPASSALRVQRVPACAFHLSSVDADTAVAPAFIQTAQANAAHGFFKITEAGRSSLGDGSGCKLQNRADACIEAVFAQARRCAVNRRVPPLARLLEGHNAHRHHIEKFEAQRRLGVIVRIEEEVCGLRHVLCSVLVGRKQLDEAREALLDAAGSGSSALHARILAAEHDSGTALKVTIGTLDQRAKQMREIAGSREVAARFGTKRAVCGSHKLLKKRVQYLCVGVCGRGVASGSVVAMQYDALEQHVYRRRQTDGDFEAAPRLSVAAWSERRLRRHIF